MSVSNYFFSLLGTGFICLTASACDTTKYNELETATVNDGAFSSALVSEYREFAKSEISQYDWPDQQTISIKGLAAANGKRPLPEDPANWRLDQNDINELTAKRADLVHWLNTDGRHSTPKQAAKAQRNYDCWVEQKEENWQHDDIAACKQGLKDNMPEIWQVQFTFDNSRLTAHAITRLKRVAHDWEKNPGKFLLIQGHADQIGTSDYNYKLSQKRARAVGIKLNQLGIPKDQIRFEVWGEARPRSSTHNVKYIQSHQQNRRVEILKF